MFLKEGILMEGLSDDNHLWLLVKKDNQEAFEVLYNRHVKAIFKAIASRISDREVAKELTQDVFISLWEKRQAIQPTSGIFSYMYGMAINRILNHYRRHKIHKEHFDSWNTLLENHIDLSELSLAFQQAHNEEMESLLEHTVAAMPERMRQVYELRYEKNLRIDEVASRLSISPHTVHNQLKNVRKRFILALRNSSYTFL